ncbi:MAG: VOC family protein [Pseudomonadota bacterium]
MTYYTAFMQITRFDHIVLCVADVDTTLEFYQRILGLEAREERPGKWSLHFGTSKISLQNATSAPTLAKGTVPGSGNFCLITELPIADIVDRLETNRIEIIEGPAEKIGATGTLMSVYFRDPDGNLVEVSQINH